MPAAPTRSNPTQDEQAPVALTPDQVIQALKYLGFTDSEIRFMFAGFSGTAEQALARFPETFNGAGGWNITSTQVAGMARQVAQGRGTYIDGAIARRAADAPSTAAPTRETPSPEDEGRQQAIAQPTMSDLDLGLNDWSLPGGGGGGGGGVSISGAPGASNQRTPPQTPEELDAYLRANYGYMAAFLDHPELGPILRQAALEGWDQNRLLGALSGTEWWQSSTESSRQWQAQQQLDPGTAADTRNGAQTNIRAIASQFGVPLSDERLAQLAEDSIRWGWSEGEITQAIAAEATFGQTQAGTISASTNDLRALSRAWLVPLGDDALFRWAQNIAAGSQTVDGFRSYLQQVAQQRFPDLAGQMASGVAPGEYFAPYQSIIAQTLEIPEAEIDFNDSRWSQVIDFVDEQGNRRPMSNYEVQRFARTQPEYDQTGQAVSDAYTLADGIGRMFGRIG